MATQPVGPDGGAYDDLSALPDPVRSRVLSLAADVRPTGGRAWEAPQSPARCRTTSSGTGSPCRSLLAPPGTTTGWTPRHGRG
jgi:hypothetical protein